MYGLHIHTPTHTLQSNLWAALGLDNMHVDEFGCGAETPPTARSQRSTPAAQKGQRVKPQAEK